MSELTLKEFKKKEKKVNETRVHKITGSLGIRQAFAFVQRHKWFNIGRAIREAQFQQIVRRINDALADEIIDGNILKFPQEMGTLELRKFVPYSNFKNGKLIVKRPINWDATLELWYNDPEAYQNKTLVRDTSNETFRILYNREHADYNNKSFYQFTVNRSIKRVLKKRIKQGQIDALM